jgi:hypothetical protein
MFEYPPGTPVNRRYVLGGAALASAAAAGGIDRLLGLTAAETARSALSFPLFIDVAAEPYNVTPSTTNPEVIIQQALDFASAEGIPEVIISHPGTYTIGGLHRVPGQVNGQVHAALWGYSNLKLTMKPGVVLKLKDNIWMPATASSCQIISVAYPYTSSPDGTKTDWMIEGGVIDGNAANQSSLVVGVAVFLGACRNSWVRDVTVKNVFGTAPGPPGETFHFDANYCQDVAFINCLADGSGSPNTATGFSANNAFGVAWTGCTALGMGFGMGFTAWQCSEMQYANCRAYGNFTGFNIERSQYVTYAGCLSGGGSPTLNAGAPVSPFFTDGQTALGNTVGYQIQGCSDLVLSGSVISGNTINIKVISNGSDKLVCRRVLFSGCVISGSGTAVQVESVATGGNDQSHVHFLACAVLDGTVIGTNYLQTTSTTPDGTPGIYSLGGATDAGINLGPKGSGKVYINVAAGQTPTLAAAGDDTDLDLNLTPKGLGAVKIGDAAVMTAEVVSVTGAQTLAAVAGRQYIILLKSGADPTLPTAVGNTSIYQIKNIQSASVTLAATSSQTIDGSSLTVDPGQSFTLISDEGNWVII